jgi:hypothetical protein
MPSKNSVNSSKLDPQSIPLLSLPFVPFYEPKRLPRLTAVYFVLNAKGTVLYVGKSINLLQRWLGHHRAAKLTDQQATRIAWLTIDDVTILATVEAACIAYFDPFCNGFRGPRVKRADVSKTRMPRGPYKKMLVRIPPDILEALEEETASSDRSVNGELVHVLRAWADQRRQTPSSRVYTLATATV